MCKFHHSENRSFLKYCGLLLKDMKIVKPEKDSLDIIRRHGQFVALRLSVQAGSSVLSRAFHSQAATHRSTASSYAGSDRTTGSCRATATNVTASWVCATCSTATRASTSARESAPPGRPSSAQAPTSSWSVSSTRRTHRAWLVLRGERKRIHWRAKTLWLFPDCETECCVILLWSRHTVREVEHKWRGNHLSYQSQKRISVTVTLKNR